MLAGCREKASSHWTAVAVLIALSACGQRQHVDGLDLLRGRNALDMARYDWARHYFAADLEDHPDRAESLRGLGLGWVSGYQGSLSQAIEAFERYLKLEPDDDEIRLRLARSWLQMGDRDRALRVAEGLGESDDKRLLIAQLFLSDQPELALEQVNAVLRAMPDDFKALHLSAQILARLGKDEMALARASQAAEIEPLSAEVIYLLAGLLRRRGRLEESAEYLATYEIVRRLPGPGITTSPSQELEWLRQIERRVERPSLSMKRRQARALLQTGQAAKAVLLVTEISSDPACGPECLLVLSQSAHTQGKTSIARDLYQRVLDQDPGHPQALAQQARLAYDCRDFATAHQLLDRGLALYPQQAPLHFTAGLVALSEGDEAGAVAAFATAVDLVPWLVHYRLTLADVLLTQGDRTAVGRLLADAPAADPKIDTYRRQHDL